MALPFLKASSMVELFSLIVNSLYRILMDDSNKEQMVRG